VRLWSQSLILGLHCRASRVSIALSVFLVVWASAQAQLTSGFNASSDAARTKYSLTGTVIDSVTGEPVRRALVQVPLGRPPATLTDSNGNFQFDDLPAGQTSIAARKPGYFSEQEIGPNRFQESNISVGPKTAPITIKLIPGGAISGRVMTSDGEAIEDVPVRLHYSRLIDGRKRWERGREARTDEQGAFRFANVLPGLYYVAAGPRRQYSMFPGASSPVPTRGYPELFYPAATDIASASPVPVTAGQHVQADFLMKLDNFYEVSGVVSGYPPNEAVNIIFLNESGDHLQFPTAFDPQTGQFHTRVPAGSYTVRAFARDVFATLPLVVHSDVSGIHLAIQPSISIPVLIQGATVKPSATVRFGRGNEAQPVNVRLTSTRASLQPSEYYAMLTGDEPHRTLAVHNLEPGTYTVEVTPNVPAYVQSVRCGDVDLLQEDLHVSSAGAPPIEVILREDVATLNGTIAGITGSAAAGVVLVPEHGSARHLQIMYVGGSELQWSGLGPGDYSVLAFDHLDSIEFRNPEVLASYLPRAAHVTLNPNAESKVSLNLIQVEK
jgi:Carboxypeptidase regulatory-like domain